MSHKALQAFSFAFCRIKKSGYYVKLNLHRVNLIQCGHSLKSYLTKSMSNIDLKSVADEKKFKAIYATKIR